MPVRLFPLVPILQCTESLLNFDHLGIPNCSKLWDTYTGVTLHTLPHDHIVRTVDISSSQNLIATGGQEKRLRLFDLQNGCKSRDIGRHEGAIKSVVWDRNDTSDNTIITSGDDKRLIWWDVRSPSPLAEYMADDMITSMEQSLDHRVITVTGGKTVLIFDAVTYYPRYLKRVVC